MLVMAVTRAPARQHLDARLAPFRALASEARPHRGWIRAVRDALGMSSTELGARMGIDQSSVIALEQSEIRDSIRLDSLRRAANALDCDLVYALVPRTSLDDTVTAQARRKAAEHLAPIAHSMRLEDQAV